MRLSLINFIPPTYPLVMFEQHISSDIIIHQEHNKIPSGNLYLRQPHTVIQLVEVASPPPRRISSVINSSSAASSSYTSSSSSSFQDQEEEEEEEEDEEEEECSSYCSSDMPLDEMDVPLSPRTASSHPDTFSGRMKRILLWREQSPQLISDSTSLKRKLQEIKEDIVDNDDNVSHTSKRSRSSGSSSSVSSDRSIISLELGMHSCPACDAFFPTRQSLRHHGRDAQSNEACSVAVEYAFE